MRPKPDWRTDALQNIPAYQVTEVGERRALVACPGDDVGVQTKLKLKLL